MYLLTHLRGKGELSHVLLSGRAFPYNMHGGLLVLNAVLFTPWTGRFFSLHLCKMIITWSSWKSQLSRSTWFAKVDLIFPRKRLTWFFALAERVPMATMSILSAILGRLGGRCRAMELPWGCSLCAVSTGFSVSLFQASWACRQSPVVVLHVPLFSAQRIFGPALTPVQSEWVCLTLWWSGRWQMWRGKFPRRGGDAVSS